MAVQREEQVEYFQNGDVVEKRRVVKSGPSTRTVFVSRASRLIWFGVSVLWLLIAFRFFLLAIGANAGSGFVNFIYSVTVVLVAPFQFITSNMTYDGGVIEVASIFAMVVYPIIGWGIIQLLAIIFSDTRSTHQETTVQYD